MFTILLGRAVKLATLATPDGTTAALLRGNTWLELPAPDLSLLIDEHGADPARLAGLAGAPVIDGRPVLPLPSPRKVVCCGLNYGEHIAETGREHPAYPTLFAKHADTLTGPHDDLQLDPGAQWDWEAELAVVVGRELRGVGREEAQAGIAGWTVANDLSARDWQRRTPQWFQGKAWDATTPLGPVVVTPDELDPTAGAEISCRVNGEEVQRDDTATLVHDAADLLAYISTFTVLRPGDVVLTGTPGGVGMARKPERYLADGDVLETEVAGIGVLVNTVRLTTQTPVTA